MKIGIEAQRLFRKKKHGMDMVALELIRNLQQIDTVNEYVIFVKPDEDDTVIKETPNFKIIPLDGGAYPLWEQVVLPKAAAKYGCQLLHCTSNTAPVFSKVPLMVTLHDIIYMESSMWQIVTGKGSNYQKFGNLYRRMVVPKIVRKSKKIITVSDYEKDCIGAYFNMQNDSRLVTVYNGVSTYFTPVTDSNTLQAVKEKYHLPDHYFFFLGNTHPKKNTKGTLAAFSQFIKQSGYDIKLVMIDYDKNELQKLLQEIGDPGLIDRIVLTGYIVNTDLPAIYGQSELFLYPSLRESFGIPLIEAMACGVPVITSSTSSMPEIAGHAASLIDPFKPETITDAMLKVYNNKALQKEMKSEGIAQAAKFSWKSMAADVLKLYQETINQ
ncbi:MAG: glycosyltransferase family 4 protein [Bacteroidetes bacterium]|nr:glycosyltransferase family 4 protein [Bacteroidota bacterium]